MEQPVRYIQRDNVMRCDICEEYAILPRRVTTNPEAFMEMLELMNLDHQECTQYKDAHMAKNARKFRKETTRQKMLAPQGVRFGVA